MSNGIQSGNFNVATIAQDITNGHKKIHKDKRTDHQTHVQLTNTNEPVIIDSGNELKIKLSTTYKSRFTGLRRRTQCTQVELFDRNGTSIGKFTFNRGWNLKGKIRKVLKRLNPASTNNSASLDRTTNDGKVQQDSNSQKSNGMTRAEALIQKGILQGTPGRHAASTQELQVKFDIARQERNGSEKQKTNSLTPESKTTTPQLTPITSQNDLQAAMTKVRKNHTQSEIQTTTTLNPTTSADTTTKTEKPADELENSVTKTTSDVAGTTATTTIDGVKSMEERVNEQLKKKIDNQQLFATLNRFTNKEGDRKGNGIAQRAATNDFLNTVSQQEFAIKNEWDGTGEQPSTPISDLTAREGKLSSKLNIFKDTADFLSPQQQISGNRGGLCGAEGNRMFSAPNNQEVELFIDLLCDPGLPMSVDERKQGLQAAMDTCTALWNDLQSDTPKLQTNISENGVELNKEYRQGKLKEWVTILQTAKDELDQKASALNLGCGAAMASVMQFTDDAWELELLGREVENLRNRFQNQKETPEPIELNFNGQKFTISASKAKLLKKAGTKITIKGPGNQEASFIFDQGRNLSEKLKTSLNSVAMQTYIERKPNAQTELKCCYARQNLNKWSDKDGNGHLMDIQTQLYKDKKPEVKEFGGLTTNVGVLRDTLKWIESGKKA